MQLIEILLWSCKVFERGESVHRMALGVTFRTKSQNMGSQRRKMAK